MTEDRDDVQAGNREIQRRRSGNLNPNAGTA